METLTIQKQVAELIKRSKNILVMASAPADGDSLGSSLALYNTLRKLNKEVTVVCADPVPEVYKFLPTIQAVAQRMISSRDLIITLDCRKAKIEQIKSNIEHDKVNIIITPKEDGFSERDVSFNYGDVSYDLIITVDCAEYNQLGKLYEDNIELFTQLPVINIDHHISNTFFGRVNYVDVMSSSTTQMLLPVVELLESDTQQKLIDEDIATLLLAGIITDTGSFQNANTTPKAFAVAAKLVSYGARQQEIIRNIYKTKKLSMLKLWGRVLSKIRTDDKYRMVWSVVSQNDFKETHSKVEQTGDIIDELMSNAPGAEVIFLLKEKEEGVVSCSLRTTTPSADASHIAEQFGGGGHTQAAGFTIANANIDQVQTELINYIRKYQAERLNIVEDEEEETPLTASQSPTAAAKKETAKKEKKDEVMKVDLGNVQSGSTMTGKVINLKLGGTHKF